MARARLLMWALPTMLASTACSLDYGGFSISSAARGGGAPTDDTSDGGAGSNANTGGDGAEAGGANNTGGTTNAGGTSNTGGSGGSGGHGVGGSGSSGMPCSTVSYPAVVSDCVNPNAPNPDTCQANAGAGAMVFDTNYADGGGGPRVIYLRFDLDGAFDESDVTSLSLRLSAPGFADADSGSTGEIWQVTSFTRADLFSAGSLPSNVGANAIAAGLGPLAPSETVAWSLPTGLAIPASSVTLRLMPLSGDTGHYFDQDGTAPPELVVSCL